MKSFRKYREAVLSFIDILGFKEIVEGKSTDEIFSILEALQSETKLGGKKTISKEKDQTKVIFFSDSIVRIRTYDKGSPEGDGPLFFEISALAVAQWILIEKGILLRGGIAHGEIYTNSEKEMLFGPAMNRGYLLESKYASFPRIIIDQKTLDEMKSESRLRAKNASYDEEKEAIKKYLSQGEDGIWFIDYLGYGCEFSQSRTCLSAPHEQKIGLVFDTLSKHKKAIVKIANKNSSKEEIFTKIKWLILYHNMKCESYSRSDQKINHYDINITFEF